MSMARSTPAQNERGLASSTSRSRTAAAQASSAGTARRSARSASRPRTAVPGRSSGASAVSTTARTTANGVGSGGASQNDSVSTASAPVCRQRLPRQRRRPPAAPTRSARGGRSARPGAAAPRAAAPTGRPRPRPSGPRTSVATTRSPGRTPGPRPPPTPATRTGRSPQPRGGGDASGADPCRCGRSGWSTRTPPPAPPAAARRPPGRASRRPRHVAAERGDREHEPVEVVVDVEVAGEAGAGEVLLVPAAVGALGVDQLGRRRARTAGPRSPAASSASSAHAVCDGVDAPRPTHAGSR